MQGGGCARDLDRQIAVLQRVDRDMQMTAKEMNTAAHKEVKRATRKRSEEPKGQARVRTQFVRRRGRASFLWCRAIFGQG